MTDIKSQIKHKSPLWEAVKTTISHAIPFTAGGYVGHVWNEKDETKKWEWSLSKKSNRTALAIWIPMTVIGSAFIDGRKAYKEAVQHNSELDFIAAKMAEPPTSATERITAQRASDSIQENSVTR